MKLRKDTQYEGVGALEGIVLRYKGGDWWRGSADTDRTVSASWTIVQGWLDAGHIQPVRGTKIVRVEDVVMVMTADWPNHPTNVPDGARSKPVTLEFEVEA